MELYLAIFGGAFTIILALIGIIYSQMNNNLKQVWRVLDEIRKEFSNLSTELVKQELNNEKRFVTKAECEKCKEE